MDISYLFLLASLNALQATMPTQPITPANSACLLAKLALQHQAAQAAPLAISTSTHVLSFVQVPPMSTLLLSAKHVLRPVLSVSQILIAFNAVCQV